MFSKGSTLCCDYISNFDVNHCNIRFGVKQELDVATLTWNKVKEYGVEGLAAGGAYIEDIIMMEV